MVDKEKLTQKKEKINVKKEETLLKANQKKTDTKIKIEEKILEKRQARNEKRIESHLNLADAKIDAAIDDAAIEIEFLNEAVELEIATGENSADLIKYKADNILEEILLRAQLRIQIAKNELIANLEDDFEDSLELGVLEDSITELKEKSSVVITTLEGKIATEKDELEEKYGDE